LDSNLTHIFIQEIIRFC